MTIYEARRLIKEKKISSQELVKDALGNVKQYNENVFITVCNDVLEKAKRADEEDVKSPLHGIPIAIKDNICTKGVLTTAGSRMLYSFVPCYDATVVKRLKRAGCVIIGKTNMDEFGMGNSGKNSAFGDLSNSINPLYVPGGSSGGSAVSVERGMALGALGSDTGGSVRLPASFLGLYSLKPTYSLISRHGLIAFASSLDTIGVIGKSALDIAILTNEIAGYDALDSTTVKRENEDYSKLNGEIKGLKIGVVKEFFENTDEDIKATIYKSLKVFEEMGADIEECSMKTLKYALSAYYIISSCEASSNLSRFDSVRFGKRCEEYKNLEEMYVKSRSENFSEEVKRRILLGTFCLSEGYYEKYYMKAKKAQSLIKKEFSMLFKKYDVLVTPVCPTGAWKKGEVIKVSDGYKKDLCTVSVNLAGLPSVSFPCGRDKNNMPVGTQLIGKPFGEKTLLNAAYAFEKGGF